MLSVATVTARGEPRISAMDGHRMVGYASNRAELLATLGIHS